MGLGLIMCCLIVATDARARNQPCVHQVSHSNRQGWEATLADSNNQLTHSLHGNMFNHPLFESWDHNPRAQIEHSPTTGDEDDLQAQQLTADNNVIPLNHISTSSMAQPDITTHDVLLDADAQCLDTLQTIGVITNYTPIGTETQEDRGDLSTTMSSRHRESP